MSLLRLVLDDPTALFDHNFGLSRLNDDIFSTPLVFHSNYTRPWRCQTHQRSRSSKDGFSVSLDVQQFKPEEISVKNVGNSITVEGKHEERQDEHGYISRHFVRRYVLPDDVEVEHVECKLSSDGVLSLEAPKKVVLNSESGERAIHITQTNQPAMQVQKTETKSDGEAAIKE